MKSANIVIKYPVLWKKTIIGSKSVAESAVRSRFNMIHTYFVDSNTSFSGYASLSVGKGRRKLYAVNYEKHRWKNGKPLHYVVTVYEVPEVLFDGIKVMNLNVRFVQRRNYFKMI